MSAFLRQAPLVPIADKPEIDGELRASPLRDASLRRTGFPLAGKTLPSPRPSKANIRLKFEGCFKGRDESNLNAAPARRVPTSIRRTKAVNIAIFVDTSAIGNLRGWGHANHATRAVSAPLESERAPAFESRVHAG
jgi:hypothetical protein